MCGCGAPGLEKSAYMTGSLVDWAWLLFCACRRRAAQCSSCGVATRPARGGRTSQRRQPPPTGNLNLMVTHHWFIACLSACAPSVTTTHAMQHHMTVLKVQLTWHGAVWAEPQKFAHLYFEACLVPSAPHKHAPLTFPPLRHLSAICQTCQKASLSAPRRPAPMC